MATTTHRHSMVREGGPRCFGGPVASGDRENPAAHGNITYIEYCSCGARRPVNANGDHMEYGVWQTAPTHAERVWNGARIRVSVGETPGVWVITASAHAGSKPDWSAEIRASDWQDCWSADPFDHASDALHIAVEIAERHPELAEWRAGRPA